MPDQKRSASRPATRCSPRSETLAAQEPNFARFLALCGQCDRSPRTSAYPARARSKAFLRESYGRLGKRDPAATRSISGVRSASDRARDHRDLLARHAVHRRQRAGGDPGEGRHGPAHDAPDPAGRSATPSACSTRRRARARCSRACSTSTSTRCRRRCARRAWSAELDDVLDRRRAAPSRGWQRDAASGCAR